MSFPRYERFKASGVDWLGEVPEHWDVSRLGFESWVRARLGWKGLKAEEYVDEGHVFLSTPNIKGRVIDFTNVNYISQERYDESAEIKLKQGDVLLAKDGSTLGTVNVVRSLPRQATVNSSIAVITPNSSLLGSYLYHQFQSSFIQDTIESLKGGMGVPHLFQKDLNKVRVLLPSIAEQESIVNFLDQETGKIDALIEAQQRLIELLKEKRQAVISHAVTNGLDPNVCLRESGDDWVGRIPAHWGCGQFTRVATRVVVGIAEATTHAYAEAGIPILRSTNIRAGKITGDLLYINRDFAESRESKSMHAGDLVTVRTGNAGVTAMIPSDLDGCQCFTMLISTLNQGMSSEYYCFFLNSQSAMAYFSIEGWGTAQVNISVPILKCLPIPIPPFEEQHRIVEFLNEEVERLNGLITTAENMSELLMERRSALISAAVTGKIDVRGYAPVETQAPETSYEPA